MEVGRDCSFEEIMEWICQAPRGTLAPGTASPPRTAPPSLAKSGNEESGIEVSESNNEDAQSLKEMGDAKTCTVEFDDSLLTYLLTLDD